MIYIRNEKSGQITNESTQRITSERLSLSAKFLTSRAETQNHCGGTHFADVKKYYAAERIEWRTDARGRGPWLESCIVTGAGPLGLADASLGVGANEDRAIRARFVEEGGHDVPEAKYP